MNPSSDNTHLRDRDSIGLEHDSMPHRADNADHHQSHQFGHREGGGHAVNGDGGEGSTLAEYLAGDYKLNMYVPGEFAGRVVGKKGVIINNLKRETKCRMINLPSPNGNWVPVIIIGEWLSVIAAYNAISDIVNGEVDGVILEYLISYKRPFFIYGKQKMHTIRTISAKSNVRIFLPETNPRDPGFVDKTAMTLEGSFDEVRRAVQLLEMEALAYRDRQENGGNRKILSKPPLPPNNDERDSRGFNKEGRQRNFVAEPRKEVYEAPKPREEEVPPPPPIDSAERDRVREKDIPSIKSESPAVSISKRLDVVKMISIPSTLVGLLLSKRPPTKMSVMNQLQNSTGTIISKIVEDGQAPNRRDSAETIESATRTTKEKESEHGDDEASIDSAQEGEGAEAVVPTENADEQNEAPGESAVKTEAESAAEFVMFRICGYAEENVDVAYEHLQKIVGGERIKDVLDLLRVQHRNLLRREDKDFRFTDDDRRDRRPSIEQRSSKERKPRGSMERASEKSGSNDGRDSRDSWRRDRMPNNDQRPRRNNDHRDQRDQRPNSRSFDDRPRGDEEGDINASADGGSAFGDSRDEAQQQGRRVNRFNKRT